MVTVAENAARKHPDLRKVTIMEHAPRFDENEVDPIGLKPRLAKFANSTISEELIHEGYHCGRQAPAIWRS